jgi:EPS-associated MarR family transcriptional regulator
MCASSSRSGSPLLFIRLWRILPVAITPSKVGWCYYESRLIRILKENTDFTQCELAEKLGISIGGLNYSLKALMEKGLVKMKNFANSKNNFGYVYVLTPSGLAEKAAITHRFLQWKQDKYETLKTEIETLKSEIKKPGGRATQKV